MDARRCRFVRCSRTRPSSAGLGGGPPSSCSTGHRLCRRGGPVLRGIDDHIASARYRALERSTGGRAAGRDHTGDALVRCGARTTTLPGRIVAPAGGPVQGYIGRLRVHLRCDDDVGRCASSRGAAGALSESYFFANTLVSRSMSHSNFSFGALLTDMSQRCAPLLFSRNVLPSNR